MGATPKLLLPYPEATDPADVPLDMKELADRIELVTGATPVSALPGSPADGQTIAFLADAANGVVWQLRYRAAATGAFKWEFIGGAALLSDLFPGSDPGTVSITYTDLDTPASPGPALTLPLAGDYKITNGQQAYNTGAGAAIMSYAIGATAAQDADSVYAGQTAGSTFSTAQRTRVKTGLAAGTVLTAKYKCSGSRANWRARSLEAVPVRVG
jgi:hypothetical protein